MKIKPEDFAVLKAAIAPLDTPARRHAFAMNPHCNRAGMDRNKRYRWDLLWASKLKIGDGVGMHGDLALYAYMDDKHIDTALRAIVPPLEPSKESA